MILYHGSLSEFVNFDPCRQREGSFGKGYYFTNAKNRRRKVRPRRSGIPGFSLKNPASMRDGLSVAFDNRKLARRGFDGFLYRSKWTGNIIVVAFSRKQIRKVTQ